MKLIHIADLHFGKSLHGLSLIENGDQPFWAERFLELVKEEQPDAVLIAGDVYDRGAPGNQAVELLDRFLTGLAQLHVPVLMISGNHDSGTKLSFASQMLQNSGLYIAGSIRGGIKKVTLSDAYGPVHFWLVPYLFPALVEDALCCSGIREYDTAMRTLLAAQDIDFNQRNVILSHQNVMAGGTAAQRGGSETMVGGIGEIDYTAYDGFEYAALGHIHAAQAMGRPEVRYAGSPLCYHFSELRNARKGPVVITLGQKGDAPDIQVRPIAPLHPLREIRGRFQEIMDQELESAQTGEYLRIVLTDDLIPTDAGSQLRSVVEANGSKLLELTREQNAQEDVLRTAEAVGEKTMDELFLEFFRDRSNGEEPDDQQMELIRFVADLLENQGSDTPAQQADAIIRFAMEQEAEE